MQNQSAHEQNQSAHLLMSKISLLMCKPCLINCKISVTPQPQSVVTLSSILIWQKLLQFLFARIRYYTKSHSSGGVSHLPWLNLTCATSAGVARGSPPPTPLKSTKAKSRYFQFFSTNVTDLIKHVCLNVSWILSLLGQKFWPKTDFSYKMGLFFYLNKEE